MALYLHSDTDKCNRHYVPFRIDPGGVALRKGEAGRSSGSDGFPAGNFYLEGYGKGVWVVVEVNISACMIKSLTWGKGRETQVADVSVVQRTRISTAVASEDTSKIMR